MAGASKAGPVRIVATLALAGLLSGLVLVGVYLTTQPLILHNQAEALNAAIYAVLPGTTEISGHAMLDGRLVDLQAGDPTGGAAIYSGRGPDGALIGFAVPAAGPGFMDTIRLIYGYDPVRRTIIGLAVLESRETPGLGDKIITDPEFAANFTELTVAPQIVAVKKGEKSRSNEVDCITGATISSEAIVSILNASAGQWVELLPVDARSIEVSQRDSGDRY